MIGEISVTAVTAVVVSVMFAASVGAAFVIAVMIVVVTSDFGIKRKTAGNQSFHRRIRIAFHASVQSDAGIGKSHLCTAADSAADQGIYTIELQESGQRAVTAAERGNNPCRGDLSVGDLGIA